MGKKHASQYANFGSLQKGRLIEKNIYSIKCFLLPEKIK